jgi:adenylate cyclase
MPDKARSIEDEWRSTLLGTNPALRAGRRFLLRLPSSPRCEMCASPFAPPFGPVMKVIGKGPFARNPRFCEQCCMGLIRQKGGAEIPLSFLFADVRGSTPLGERLGPRGLHGLMDRFYADGIDTLIAYGALIDRFMGDQVVGYFVPGFAGPQHARQAVRCGLEILRVTGHGDTAPWVPVGVGVHTGTAFVGSVGKGDDMAELTAIGDSVNVAARLASAAGTGEVVASEEAFGAAAIEGDPERRELRLKGVTAPVNVRVLRLKTP